MRKRERVGWEATKWLEMVCPRPARSSLYALHPILMEPKKTESRWLASLTLLPEDSPVLSWLLG